jgi:hypothetical protein
MIFVSGKEGVLGLPFLGINLPLQDIYRNVVWEGEEQS